MNQISNNEKILFLEYEFNQRLYFNEDGSLHKIMQNHHDTILKKTINNEIILSITFEELAEFYLMYGLYSKMFFNEKKANHLLASASCYAYGLLVFFNKGCSDTHTSIVMMRKAIYTWSSLFLVGWEDEAIHVGNELIDSLNKNGNIIRYGNRLYPESWFVLELFSLAFEKPFNKERVDYPEKMQGYEIILEKWDTKHLTLVDDFVTVLCDLHLQTREPNEDEPDFEYLNFNKSIMKYYPYTVMGYLAMRKYTGLKNPTKFTHPLMNTPIAKMFLNIKEPLPKPAELPYTKELLEKLKEKCPDVEIPEWLEGNTEQVLEAKKEETQNNDIIPDDFLK